MPSVLVVMRRHDDCDHLSPGVSIHSTLALMLENPATKIHIVILSY